MKARDLIAILEHDPEADVLVKSKRIDRDFDPATAVHGHAVLEEELWLKSYQKDELVRVHVFVIGEA